MNDYLSCLRFCVNALWDTRHEPLPEIGRRYERYLRRLGEVNAVLTGWRFGMDAREEVALTPGALAALVQRNVVPDDAGNPDPMDGYHLSAESGDPRQRFYISGKVGSVYRYAFANRLFFETCDDRPADPQIVTYALMKGVVLAIVDAWEPGFCAAFSSKLLPGRLEGTWHSAWMTYVPPAEAGGIDLVGVPFSEWTPDGGLLLSATEETFDAANPAHVAGARRLHEATRHLNPPSDLESWDDDADDLPGERID